MLCALTRLELPVTLVSLLLVANNLCLMLMRLTFLIFSLLISTYAIAQPYFGNGIKIGETTSDSTIVWLRLTERVEPNWKGLKWLGVEDRDFEVGELGEKQFSSGAKMADMEGSLLGMEGSVRFSWWPKGKTTDMNQTEWLPVGSNRVVVRQLKRLMDLFEPPLVAPRASPCGLSFRPVKVGRRGTRGRLGFRFTIICEPLIRYFLFTLVISFIMTSGARAETSMLVLRSWPVSTGTGGMDARMS